MIRVVLVLLFMFSVYLEATLTKIIKMICWIFFLMKKIVPRIIIGKPTKELFCG